MDSLPLAAARAIVAAAFAKAATLGLKPLAIAVLDARGVLKVFEAQDGTAGLVRPDIARGKAYGALALGQGSRAINRRMAESPHLVTAMMHATAGAIVPLAGGVLIRDAGGRLLGAVGVSGDTSDSDETVALAGIAAAELVGDGG